MQKKPKDHSIRSRLENFAITSQDWERALRDVEKEETTIPAHKSQELQGKEKEEN